MRPNETIQFFEDPDGAVQITDLLDENNEPITEVTTNEFGEWGPVWGPEGVATIYYGQSGNVRVSASTDATDDIPGVVETVDGVDASISDLEANKVDKQARAHQLTPDVAPGTAGRYAIVYDPEGLPDGQVEIEQSDAEGTVVANTVPRRLADGHVQGPSADPTHAQHYTTKAYADGLVNGYATLDGPQTFTGEHTFDPEDGSGRTANITPYGTVRVITGDNKHAELGEEGLTTSRDNSFQEFTRAHWDQVRVSHHASSFTREGILRPGFLNVEHEDPQQTAVSVVNDGAETLSIQANGVTSINGTSQRIDLDGDDSSNGVVVRDGTFRGRVRPAKVDAVDTFTGDATEIDQWRVQVWRYNQSFASFQAFDNDVEVFSVARDGTVSAPNLMDDVATYVANLDTGSTPSNATIRDKVNELLDALKNAGIMEASA
ncbi:hypothetical protein [Phytoactinopolyspora halophila]|uniref:hypothetical protein n=1 Tax=Phytoactinopolyspora halophila TaxID=1981511 RepID=UPI000F4E6159|nr:hypothetical protein [Phytoactinopolyspora halophila]